MAESTLTGDIGKVLDYLNKTIAPTYGMGISNEAASVASGAQRGINYVSGANLDLMKGRENIPVPAAEKVYPPSVYTGQGITPPPVEKPVQPPIISANTMTGGNPTAPVSATPTGGTGDKVWVNNNEIDTTKKGWGIDEKYLNTNGKADTLKIEGTPDKRTDAEKERERLADAIKYSRPGEKMAYDIEKGKVAADMAKANADALKARAEVDKDVSAKTKTWLETHAVPVFNQDTGKNEPSREATVWQWALDNEKPDGGVAEMPEDLRGLHNSLQKSFEDYYKSMLDSNDEAKTAAKTNPVLAKKIARQGYLAKLKRGER